MNHSTMYHNRRALLLPILLASLLAGPVAAQVFNQDYHFMSESEIETLSSEVSLRVPKDGSFITVDTRLSPSGVISTLLLRVDPFGSVMWAVGYGGGGGERGNSIALSHDERDVLLTGTALGDVWIARVEIATGNLLWSFTYGEPDREEGNVIRPIADSLGKGYVIAGKIHGNDQSIYLIRIDENGKSQYQLRYDAVGVNSFIDHPTAMLGDIDEVLLTGLHEEDGKRPELFVLPFNTATGLHQMMIHYEHPDPADALRLPMLAEAKEGYMAAYSVEVLGKDPRIAALRLDNNLAPLWEYHYTASGTPSGPLQEASWGLSVALSDERYALGVALADRSHAGILTIKDDGNPIDLWHYEDMGFTKPGVSVGDTVSPMFTDDDGYLLKNHLPRGISLTRVDTALFAPCPNQLDVSVDQVEVEHKETEYTSSKWGYRKEHPVKAEDLWVIEDSCP